MVTGELGLGQIATRIQAESKKREAREVEGVREAKSKLRKLLKESPGGLTAAFLREHEKLIRLAFPQKG